MPDHIEIALSRVAWARKHIDAFDLESGRFIESGAHQVVREQETEGDFIRYTWKFKVTEDLPNYIPFIFGDAIHNLRATCDWLLSALRAKNGFAGNNNFPICLTSHAHSGRNFAKWRADNRRLGVLALDAIESLQPFNPYTGPNGTLTMKDHSLWILDALWNRDKHESPIEVANLHSATTFSVPNGFGPAVIIRPDEFIRGQPGGPVQDDAVLFSYCTPLDHTSNFEIKAAVGICLKKDGPIAPGKPAYGLLLDMHDFVRDEVIARLKPFLT